MTIDQTPDVEGTARTAGTAETTADPSSTSPPGAPGRSAVPHPTSHIPPTPLRSDWNVGRSTDGDKSRRLLARAASEHWDTRPRVWRHLSWKVAKLAKKSESLPEIGGAVRTLLVMDRWNFERVTVANWAHQHCDCTECREKARRHKANLAR